MENDLNREDDLNKAGPRRIGRFGSIIIFLVVILILSFFMKPTQTVNFNFEDESCFTVEMASGYSTTVIWDEINSVEVRETLDLGVLLNGTDTDEEQSGIWENDEFGTYTLCTDAKVDCYLVLHTESGIVVVNFESSESTGSLGEAIEEKCYSE